MAMRYGEFGKQTTSFHYTSNKRELNYTCMNFVWDTTLQFVSNIMNLLLPGINLKISYRNIHYS